MDRDRKKSRAGNDSNPPQRIAKVLARAGVGSRRDVERLIAAGQVRLDGKLVETPATLIPGTDGVTVKGEPVAQPQPARIWRYHKPTGLVTTNRDPEGRRTVFDALPDNLPRVISIGRLDINTEGLLLLTNDGAIARWIELPETGWQRHYRVRVYGIVNEAALEKLKKGITVEGVKYGPIEATLARRQGNNSWLEIGLREGKNREIKKVLEHLRLRVNRLIRTSFGPFELGNLSRGEVSEIPARAIGDNLPASLGGGSREKAHAKARPRPATGAKSKRRPGKASVTMKKDRGGKAERKAPARTARQKTSRKNIKRRS